MEGNFLPKEFLAINWREQVEDNGQFLSEEFISKHSATYKILNDEFTKVWSSDSDDDAKKKVNENINQKVHKPKEKKTKQKTIYKPFTGYPKESSLTTQQQEVFLTLMDKFTNNHSPFLSPQEQKELRIYRVLQEKVNQEQVEFTYFVRDYAFANQSRYLSIKPGIRKYINELWKSKLKIPLRYPQFYESFRTVPLVLVDKGWKIELLPEDTALELGRVNRLLLYKKDVQIETEYVTFMESHPIINDDDQSESFCFKRYPVSQDTNADNLAKLKNAEFVISSSGLKRICDNHGPLFQKSWELPVTVKEYASQGNVQKKRIIFIDKALPKKKLTVVEKIIWFHKMGIKTSLLNSSPNSSINLQKRIPKEKFQGNTSNKASEGDTLSAGNNVSEFRTKCGDVNQRDLSAKIDEEEKSAGVSNKEPLTKSDSSEKFKDDKIMNDSVDESSCDSSDLSDSDEDNLVIEEDSSVQSSKDISTPKKVVGQKPKDTSPQLKPNALSSEKSITPSTPDNGGKKPVTRSVTKMLENLNKVEKLLGKNEKGTVTKYPTARKLMVELDKNLEPSNRLEGASNKGNKELKEEQESESTLLPSGKRKKGNVRKAILDELIEQQNKMLGYDEKLLEDARSDKKYLRRPAQPLVDFIISPAPEGSNLVYRPFILRRKELSGSTFKILVRCKYDAVEFNKKLRVVSIVPKLEFQPEFGAEALTMSELTSQWLSLLIKPDSLLVRARIDAFSSKVVMTEQKEIKDLAREEKLHNVQASSCLSTLYSVLRAISDIPPGQYVLSHNAKLGAFANLYRAINTPRDGCYDLHKQYDVDPSIEETQNIANLWIPIDFGIITPSHRAWSRVPGTFNPGTAKKKKKKSKAKH